VQTVAGVQCGVGWQPACVQTAGGEQLQIVIGEKATCACGACACGACACAAPHCCTALGVGQMMFRLGWQAGGWVQTVAAVLPPPH
jgi:hypothetical protein